MRGRTLHSRFLRAVVGVSAMLLAIAGGFVYRAALAHYVHAEQSSVRAMVTLR